MQWVVHRVRTAGLDAVVPLDDATTFAVATAAEEIPATVVAPSIEGLRPALDKRALAEEQRAAGLLVPAGEEVRDPADAERLARRWGRVVIKSAIAYAHSNDDGPAQGGRVHKTHEPAAAAAAAADILSLEESVLVQAEIVGDEYGVGGVRSEDGALAVVVQRRTRSWPLTGGPSSVARSVGPDPTVIAPVARLLEYLEWRGVAQLDLLIGPTGPVIVDLNARIWFSVRLAIECGIDVPVLALAVARGEAVRPARGTPGTAWIYADSELRYLACLVFGWRGARNADEGLARGLRRWRAEVARPRVVDPFDRADPLPGIERWFVELPRTLLRNRRAARRVRRTAPPSVAIQPAIAHAELQRGLGRDTERWDGLLDLMPHPFFRSWWLLETDPDFEVLAVRDAGELIGGVPLSCDHRGGVARWRFAGDRRLAPFGMDLLARPGDEHRVASALRAWFTRSGSRIADLTGLRPESWLEREVLVGGRREVVDQAPWIDPRGGLTEYLARRGRKLRQETKRLMRRAADTGLVLRTTETDEVSRALADLERLHRTRWGRQSLFLPSFAHFAAAARRGALRGEVRFVEVVAANAVVASLATIELGARTWWYQMGREVDPQWTGTGSLLKAHAIERAAEAGCERIELCQGTGASKRSWSDGEAPVVHVVWATGWPARAAQTALLKVEPWARRVRSRITERAPTNLD